jgi:hypothetical protein
VIEVPETAVICIECGRAYEVAYVSDYGMSKLEGILTDIDNWAKLVGDSADHNYEEFKRLAGHDEEAALECERSYDVESTQEWELLSVAKHIRKQILANQGSVRIECNDTEHIDVRKCDLERIGVAAMFGWGFDWPNQEGAIRISEPDSNEFIRFESSGENWLASCLDKAGVPEFRD